MTVVNTVPPVISGVNRQGQVLTSSPGTWQFDLDYLTYQYQWERCDAFGNNATPITGATLQTYTVTAADVGSTLRVLVTVAEHANPAPSAGTLRGHFTDFFTQWGYSASDHNGQIFQNRWNLGVNFGLQTLSDPQTPWSSIGGPAITEVTNSGYAGFRFQARPEMLASSGGKKVEIYESGGNPYGAAMVRGAPYTDEISFRVLFPASGNPSGFPPSSDWNVFWQHDTGTISGFGIDGDPSHDPFRFYCGLLRANNTNPPGGRVQPSWHVQYDVSYLFHFIVKWSTGSDGTWKWWIKRPSDSAEIQYMNYTGVTQSSNRPNTEFGYYGAASLNNEVIITDIRVINH